MSSQALIDPFVSSPYAATTLGDRPANVASDPFQVWLRLAQPKDRLHPEHQRVVKEIESLTGWSDRRLADALAVSHPTIGKIRQGFTNDRLGSRGHFLPRLTHLGELVPRIARLTGGDGAATTRALLTKPAGRSKSAIGFVLAGDRESAYLAAIEVLRPRDEDEFLSGDFPAPTGTATVALDDEDE